MNAHMLLIVAVAFFVGWLLLKIAWNVASFGVHVLLGLAVLAVIAHVLRGKFGGRSAHSGA